MNGRGAEKRETRSAGSSIPFDLGAARLRPGGWWEIWLGFGQKAVPDFQPSLS